MRSDLLHDARSDAMQHSDGVAHSKILGAFSPSTTQRGSCNNASAMNCILKMRLNICTLEVSLMVHKSSDCVVRDWCRRYCLKMLPVLLFFFLQTIALSLYQFYFVIPVISLLVATNLFVKMLWKHQLMTFSKSYFSISIINYELKKHLSPFYYFTPWTLHEILHNAIIQNWLILSRPTISKCISASSHLWQDYNSWGNLRRKTNKHNTIFLGSITSGNLVFAACVHLHVYIPAKVIGLLVPKPQVHDSALCLCK